MATFKARYQRAKQRLLTTPTIARENRELFGQFFEHEEYKLQRQNDLRELDEACYKTLYLYVYRLRKVNDWFGNKPWTQLTREDIKRVYDDLEDGRLRNQMGQPYKSTEHYYDKVLKSKPFELAGKAQLAREVIQFPKRRRPTVRYVTNEGFRTLASVLTKPHHLLLFWLAWDIGENIDALLQLQKKDFKRATDPHTKEPEYLVNFPQAKIKRSRQTRTEPTLYPETVRYCDMVLAELADDDQVFLFGYRQALKLIHNAGRKTGVTCFHAIVKSVFIIGSQADPVLYCKAQITSDESFIVVIIADSGVTKRRACQSGVDIVVRGVAIPAAATQFKLIAFAEHIRPR